MLASGDSLDCNILLHISKILYSDAIECHFLLGNCLHLWDNSGDLRDLSGSGSNEGCRDDVDGYDWLDNREGVVGCQRFMVNHLHLLSLCVLDSSHLGSILFITKNDGFFLKFAIRSGLDENGFCWFQLGKGLEDLSHVKLMLGTLQDSAISSSSHSLASEHIHSLSSDTLLDSFGGGLGSIDAD